MFLPNPPLGNEKIARTSNEIPYPEQENLLGPGFLVNLTGPYKECFNIKLLSL